MESEYNFLSHCTKTFNYNTAILLIQVANALHDIKLNYIIFINVFVSNIFKQCGNLKIYE